MGKLQYIFYKDHAAAAIAKSIPVFAKKGESLEGVLGYVDKIFMWSDDDLPLI